VGAEGLGGPVRVLLVDDHPVVRDGLRGVLEGAGGFEVVGEAGDGAQALRMVGAARPDVVLMDLRMPVLDGVGATARMRAEHPGVPVLVLTTFDRDADIVRAIDAGATGYLLKDAPREELHRAVRAAARGETVLAPAVAARLVGRLRGPGSGELSARERDVLRHVARGCTNREIAAALHVSEATVKTHLLNAFAKLGVDDRTAAVVTALERGELELGQGP
jgi:DNA-binding NarL/FixJ family response regulator